MCYRRETIGVKLKQEYAGGVIYVCGKAFVVPSRAHGRDVHFAAGDYAHPRSPLQGMRFDVPSGTAQHFVPCGGQARECNNRLLVIDPDLHPPVAIL